MAVTGELYNPLSLSEGKKHRKIDKLENDKFRNVVNSKICKEVLEHLNEHELMTSSHLWKIQCMKLTLQIEHILPQKFNRVTKWTIGWNKDDGNMWFHWIGNLSIESKIEFKNQQWSFFEKQSSIANHYHIQ